MAAPTFNDYLKALDESVDEPSARNAFAEFTKRTGSTGPQTERAAGALRQRLSEISGSPGQLMEHYGRDGLTVKPKPSPSPGAALSEEVVVASTPIPEEVGAAPGGTPTEIVLASTRNPLMPVTTGKALAQAFKAWQDTAESLKNAADITMIHGKEYYNITFWRKIAVAYGIEAWPRPGSRKMFIETDGTTRAEVEMTVKAPNGRSCVSFGIASTKEARLKGVSEHDLMARAWSRAFVRGMRDLVGFGAPSAEEVEE